MVYLMTDINIIPKDVYERFIRFLPEQKKEKVERLYHYEDSCQCLMAYILLRWALHNKYGITEKIDLVLGTYGKPYIRQQPNICFNISHCRQGVACIVGEKSVGIDIQDFCKIEKEIYNHVCTEKERYYIENAVDSRKAFVELWTKKESYLKYKGKGLTDDLNRLDFAISKEEIFIRYGCYIETVINDNYAMSFCCEENKYNIRCITLNDVAKMTYLLKK